MAEGCLHKKVESRDSVWQHPELRMRDVYALWACTRRQLLRLRLPNNRHRSIVAPYDNRRNRNVKQDCVTRFATSGSPFHTRGT